MALHLAPDVHVVAIGDDLVFLDAGQDAYLCLVAAAAHVAVSDRVTATPEAAECLLQAGLVVEGAAARPRPAIPVKATRDLGFDRRRPSARETRAALCAWISTAAAFRLQSFLQLLTAPPPALAARDKDAAAEAVAAWKTLAPWSPISGACLKRSFMLRAYLRGLGLDADWVIGVRTWPFMAHCWLQVDDLALDEDVERLTAYTPILAA